MNRFDAFIEERLEFINIRFLSSRNKDAIVMKLRHPSSLEFFKRNILAFNRCKIIFLFWSVGKGINLIKYHNTWDLCYCLFGFLTCLLLFRPWISLLYFGLLS